MSFDRIKLWTDPVNSGCEETLINKCRPEHYIGLNSISEMLTDTITRYAKKSWSVLEIGSGVGRNLVKLREAGFRHLKGIEISTKAIEIGIQAYPEYEKIEKILAPVEDVIKDIRPVSVILTSGLLMHLPYDLDWVIEEISKKATRLIVTNEAEMGRRESIHVWRRDYQQIFESLGWRQIEYSTGDKCPPLPPWTIKRVFIPEE